MPTGFVLKWCNPEKFTLQKGRESRAAEKKSRKVAIDDMPSRPSELSEKKKETNQEEETSGLLFVNKRYLGKDRTLGEKAFRRFGSMREQFLEKRDGEIRLGRQKLEPSAQLDETGERTLMAI